MIYVIVQIHCVLKIFCLHILYWKSGINISYYSCLSPFSSVDVCFIYLSSVAQSCLTLCDPMNCSMPGVPVQSPTPGVHPNPCPSGRWCHPAISSSVIPFSSCPQSFPASGLCITWPKYWSFNSFIISPSNEHRGLISFRMDWLDLLAVQGTLKSLLQQHSSKASILQHSDLFIVQHSHLYMTTGKIIALAK